MSWHVKRDLSVFPVSSSSYVVILKYLSGENALGGAVMAITSILSPAQVCFSFKYVNITFIGILIYTLIFTVIIMITFIN